MGLLICNHCGFPMAPIDIGKIEFDIDENDQIEQIVYCIECAAELFGEPSGEVVDDEPTQL